MGNGPGRSRGTQAGGGNCGAGVEALQPRGEAADGAQPLGEVYGAGALGKRRPGDREVSRDAGSAGLGQESQEPPEQVLCSLQLVSEGPADEEVVLQGGVDVGHAAPPGHGRASARSEAWSTLA